MRSGKLRHKVALYVPTDTVSAMGEIETSFVLLGSYYASVSSSGMGEANSEGSLTSTTGYKIHMRYNASDLTDIPPAAFLVFQGRTLQIRSVAFYDHRNRIIEVIAEEAR